MIHLEKFIASMEKHSRSDPMMQRWLYATKELEHLLAERLIRLCKYPNMIPKVLLIDYSDVLIEALEKEGTSFVPSEDLMGSLIAFVESLEIIMDAQMAEKARKLRTFCY